MKDTIKAIEGYHVTKVRNIITSEEAYRVEDGSHILFVARRKSWDDYKDEKEQNECFHRCDVFTTEEGNQFVYWRDEEIDADYITKVPKEV